MATKTKVRKAANIEEVQRIVGAILSTKVVLRIVIEDDRGGTGYFIVTTEEPV